eukprot:scaffold14848_cov140-Isochrysis_galbana.AAC.1
MLRWGMGAEARAGCSERKPWRPNRPTVRAGRGTMAGRYYNSFEDGRLVEPVGDRVFYIIPHTKWSFTVGFSVLSHWRSICHDRANLGATPSPESVSPKAHFLFA